MIGAVIVAVGTAKGLLHINGQAIIERLLDAYRRIDCVVVVTQGETLRALEAREDIERVVGDAGKNLVDAYARGLEALGEHVKAAIVQPVESAFTTEEMVERLLAGGTRTTRVLCHGGRPGYPVLVPRSLFGEISTRPSGAFADVLWRQDVELVEWADDRVLADLEVPLEFERWREKIEGALH